MKLIFSSHQIDLSSEDTFFIYISSVLSSSIIFSTIRYMMFMLAPKFLETLHSDEHKITKFFKRFEKQYDEYKTIEEKK